MNPNKLFSRAAEGGFEEIEKKGGNDPFDRIRLRVNLKQIESRKVYFK
jgi:hypothetical protein